VADYGVNIRVGVQGQSNARQLGEQIKEIVRGLENADKAFTKFSNNLKSFDQRRAQRAINDELDKTAEKYRILDRLQRQLLANDNSGIKAAQKRANLEEHISKTISAGRMRRQAAFLRGDPAQYPSGANQPFAPDPMVAIKKQRDAEKKFAREIFDIEQDFARKHNATQIDLLLDRTKREMDLQKDLFDNAIRLTKQEGKDFDKELKRRTQARKVAGEAIRLTGQTSPIGGAVGIPGSPAALRAAERVERIKSAQGSALIGGAFPLLFGQGFGAAAGGAAGGFGGGMLGGSFGFGLSLVGTALGSAVDTFIADQSRLAESLSETTDVFASLEASGYQVSDSLKDVVARLKGQGRFASQTTIGMIPGTKEAVSDFVRNAQEVATTRTNMFGFAELSSADRKRLAKVKEKELQVEKAILDINRDQAVIAAKKDAQRRKALSFLREEQKLATQIANLQASALSAEARINTMRSAQALAGVSAMQTAKKADIKAQKQLQEGFLELVRAGKYDQSAIGQIFEQLRLVDVAQIKNEMQELSAVLMPFMSNQEITALTGTGANDTPVGALFSVLMNISKVRFDQQEKSFKTIQDLLDERIQTMNLETDILLAGSEADATRLQLQLELNEAKKEAIALGLNEVQTAELLAAVRNRATKLEEKRKKDKDPRVRMQEELDKLLEKEAQVELAALAIGDAFASSFRSIIDGTKSANEAIADMLSSVAEHFMDMATQIIAKQLAIIAYGLIMKALGVGLNPSQDGIGGLSIGSPSEFGGGNLFSQNLAGATGATFAEGGYVSGPTRALIGEGGEPEYIIPESKMRESMARYSRGARGGSVIPENGGGSGTMDASGGTAVTAPIDVRYTVERINSVDYVTADQFQQGMQQAANQGAKQGEQQTLKRLQMSSSTRKRLGM
jgi:ribosomal protein S30